MIRAALSLALSLLLAGCQLAAAESTPAPAPPPPQSASAKAPARPAPKASAEREASDEAPGKESRRAYSLPFVRDPEAEDPGDRARGLLQELVKENAAFVKSHSAKFFKPFVDSQKPRATLVTCSDSRVQSPALDATPENDLFTVRNIGNQVGTAPGSVAYGVEHLKTPVLLILGHTGCGAVKAAMGDHAHEPVAIRREIDRIDLSPLDKDSKEAKDKSRAGENQAWTDAVIVNVNHQVAIAAGLFAEQLASHDLIVVGAVYDFRNDMKQGQGKINIVNVNGHTEPAKIIAFAKALDSAGPVAVDSTHPALIHLADNKGSAK